MPDYTRFIILSNARTGSNLLQQSLNSHPAVVCFRELFNLDPSYIDYDREGWDGHDQHDLELREKDVRRFLAERVFADHEQRIRAVGFKFHYDHFWHDAELIPALTSDSGLRVVHLRRLNRLRTLVSVKIAEQTGAWMLRDESQHRVQTIRRKVGPAQLLSAAVHPIESVGRLRRFMRPPVPVTSERQELRLTLDECRAFFYKIQHEESHFSELFSAHKIHDITYEDLVARRDEVLAGVCSFLGVPDGGGTTTLRRQNPEPLRELIANYDELRAAFAGQPEEAFFDE